MSARVTNLGCRMVPAEGGHRAMRPRQPGGNREVARATHQGCGPKGQVNGAGGVGLWQEERSQLNRANSKHLFLIALRTRWETRSRNGNAVAAEIIDNLASLNSSITPFGEDPGSAVPQGRQAHRAPPPALRLGIRRTGIPGPRRPGDRRRDDGGG
jgi:hypothetical protein